MLHHKLYVLPLVFAALLFLLPLHGLAATVEYSSGTHLYVIGNPINAGDSVGMGGQDDPDAIRQNANASGNTVTVTGGMVNLVISGGCYIEEYLEGTVANDNRVDITNFTGGKKTRVFGGYAETTRSASGIIAITMRNNVTVRGGGSTAFSAAMLPLFTALLPPFTALLCLAATGCMLPASLRISLVAAKPIQVVRRP